MSSNAVSEVWVEIDQIWADEPGTFLRLCRDDVTGKALLEIRTGPQGSTAASTCRQRVVLTAYRALRLRDQITAHFEGTPSAQ